MSKRKKIIITSIVLLVIILIASLVYFLKLYKRDFNIKQISNNQLSQVDRTKVPKISLVAKNLEVPWGMVFLPDGSMIVTERPGRVRIIEKDGNLDPNPIIVIDEVEAINEGGLLGITISPDFDKDGYVFLYYTYDADKTLNRVVRYRYTSGGFGDRKIIIDAIPGAAIHNGGRLKFGPDGYLYVTTGDSADPSLAQDKNSLAGKVLRLDKEGGVPRENPFGTPVFSYGHRNPQGITWDSDYRLWVTEHGQIATDELNLVQSGKNYGWPDIVGNQSRSGMETPVAQSGDQNWAPSGAAFLEGSIYFAGLRGMGLYKAKINGESVEITKHFDGSVGRIRDVIVGPDGFLYISTSNRDGRNTPLPDDDRIFRVNTTKL
jgi:glucose/arabinose dehydrogenase